MFGLRSRISLKDNFAITFLILVDFFEWGSHEYHRNPVYRRYPTKFTPFGRSKKYIEKITQRNLKKTQTYYQLKKEKVLDVDSDDIVINFESPWWQEFLNYRFRFFIAPEKWNHKWTVITYDIPEAKSDVRNSFRYVIKKLGFECWQRSVWLTINPVKEQIKEILSEWNLINNVTVFKAENLFSEKDDEIIEKLFNPKSLVNKYKSYISKANYHMKNKNINEIRDMVDRFPEQIVQDSGIPSEFLSDIDIREKMISTYQKLVTLL